MKKIPTVFKRIYENGKVVGCLDEFTSDLTKQAFLHGTPTIKFDGACCAIFDGVFYKRYDAKHGKTPPQGAIPCCPPDPVTGHWPHWIKVDINAPENKWFVEAFKNSLSLLFVTSSLKDGTYEAVGKHFQGNPYEMNYDILIKHGMTTTAAPKTFEGIKQMLQDIPQEGIVYWLNNEPAAKIKRTDFGFKWPIK